MSVASTVGTAFGLSGTFVSAVMTAPLVMSFLST
jgi:hypothetical protein